MNTSPQRLLRQRGFTLVEAMVVISIVAVLAGLSAPTFTWFNQVTQIRSAAFDLVADLDFARSEAVKRNNDVVVAPVGGAWGNGWTVTAGGTVLRQRPAPTGQVSFTTAPGTLTFDGAGHSSVGGVVSVNNFQICPPAGGGALNGRSVRVDPSGLSRSSRSACNT